MLEVRHRTLLLESLRPPVGYRLEAAIGTSYTLDLMALLCVPLAFTWFDWEDEEGRPSADPLALLEALRRHARRIHVFCQAGMTALPPTGKPLLVYLERSIVEVKPPTAGGIFHPKVWVLRFVDGKGAVRYRVLVLTRNLTFDRSWDTCLVLEGDLKDRQRAYARNHPLADFVESLPGLAVRGAVSGEAVAATSLMQEELRRVAFEVPEGFDEDSLRFHPLGSPGYEEAWPFPQDVPGNRRLLVVSPFLDIGSLRWFVEVFPLVEVVSRPEVLARLPEDLRSDVGRLWTLVPEADPETEEEGEAAPGLEGLHAKLFVLDDGWKGRLWTGSANATTHAFERNVEFLVELAGPNKAFGVDALVAPEKGGLAPLLQEFTGPFEQPDEEAQRVEALERELDAWADRAALLPFVAQVDEAVASAEGACWNLEVSVDEGLLGVPPELGARSWPVTLAEHRAQSTRLDAGVVGRFERLPTALLTSFVALELTLARDGIKRSTQRVLNVRLVGGPPDREQRVLRDIIRSPEQLLRLLWLLLGRELPGVEELGAALDPGSGTGTWRGGGTGFPLLERLLEAVARDPAGLEDVRRLLEDLEATDEGRALVPEGLRAIWPAVMAVHAERAR